MACKYYIENIEYSESEFKSYLVNGALKEYINDNIININKLKQNAVQINSTTQKVSPTGEGRKDITEGGEGVGQGKQGEKATQEGVQEKIDALVDKSLPASERRKIMQENPLIKRIFDNIKELHKQLEEKGLITKEGNCP